MGLSYIFQLLVPKDKKFFPLFEADADNVVKGAVLLNKLFLVKETHEREQVIKEIKEHERQGDEFTHKIFDELNKSFITPFDREDIYRLNASLDDILDFINSSAQKLRLNRPAEIPAQFLELSELILQGTREVKNALSELGNLKNSQKIRTSCIRINEIENQADDIYHSVMSELFEKETNAIELIKKIDILQSLEMATDKAEDVADVLKAIIVKMA